MHLATPIMDEILALAASDPSIIHYGWVRDGNRHLFRGVHLPDDSTLACYFAGLTPLIQKLTDNAAKLEKFVVHGPASKFMESISNADVYMTSQEREVKEEVESSDLWPDVYEEVDDGYFSKIKVGDMSAKNSLVTMHPHYKIHDWDQAQPIVQALIEVSAREPGCIFYSWHMSGDTLICREGFIDGESAIKHLSEVGQLKDTLVDGPASLDRIEVHGPTAEIEKLKVRSNALRKLGSSVEFFEEHCQLEK